MATTIRLCVWHRSKNDESNPIHSSLPANTRTSNGLILTAASVFPGPSASPPLP